MKLKNIFMYAAAITVLIGCSDDKEPILDKPVELDPTTMSICIDADGTIISKAETDRTIANMYVLIFKGDALVRAEPIKTGDTTGDNGAENVDIEVDAGDHKVLVLANVQDAGKVTTIGKTLSAIQGELNSLEKEVDGSLTMSSEVMSVTFMPAVKNKIGYSNIGAGEYNAYSSLTSPVKLYRSVARIQLTQIGLSENVANDQYGEPVSFELTKIFVANAKGVSYLASNNFAKEAADYLAIGVANDITPPTGAYLWYYGTKEGATANDQLRTVTNTVLPDGKLVADIEDVTVAVDNYYPTTADVDSPLGKKFYVYENENQTIGTQTLLILKGNYTYRKATKLFDEDTENADGTFTANNRYYAIPVNVNGTITPTGIHRVLKHTGVIRNTRYSLIITLTGPGSDYPYIPDAHLYYNAKVQVADWNAPIDVETGKPDNEIN